MLMSNGSNGARRIMGVSYNCVSGGDSCQESVAGLILLLLVVLAVVERLGNTTNASLVLLCYGGDW